MASAFTALVESGFSVAKHGGSQVAVSGALVLVPDDVNPIDAVEEVMRDVLLIENPLTWQAMAKYRVAVLGAE